VDVKLLLFGDGLRGLAVEDARVTEERLRGAKALPVAQLANEVVALAAGVAVLVVLAEVSVAVARTM
jgi:hypothetical protein